MFVLINLHFVTFTKKTFHGFYSQSLRKKFLEIGGQPGQSPAVARIEKKDVKIRKKDVMW